MVPMVWWLAGWGPAVERRLRGPLTGAAPWRAAAHALLRAAQSAVPPATRSHLCSPGLSHIRVAPAANMATLSRAQKTGLGSSGLAARRSPLLAGPAPRRAAPSLRVAAADPVTVADDGRSFVVKEVRGGVACWAPPAQPRAPRRPAPGQLRRCPDPAPPMALRTAPTTSRPPRRSPSATFARPSPPSASSAAPPRASRTWPLTWPSSAASRRPPTPPTAGGWPPLRAQRAMALRTLRAGAVPRQRAHMFGRCGAAADSLRL